MKQYLEIIRDVLENGEWKTPERVIGDSLIQRTKTIPHAVLKHDMRNGFPALTVRKMPFKTMKVELEGFLGGITDKGWYKERNCNIWNEWANPELVEKIGYKDSAEKRRVQYDCLDLGPFYAWQMRAFGKSYHTPNCLKMPPRYHDPSDQLAQICKTLKTRPNDRRMVCSYWNPPFHHQAALPSCHYSWSVQHCNGHLDMCYTMRSCDLVYGSCLITYGLLLSLLAKYANFSPRYLTAIFMDCHIYENQIDGCYEMLKREPKLLPTLDLEKTESDGSFNIFNWTYSNGKLLNYNPGPNIKFGEIVV